MNIYIYNTAAFVRTVKSRNTVSFGDLKPEPREYVATVSCIMLQ
jgi:hypothetical protein